MALRSVNFSTLDLFEDDHMQETMLNLKIAPDFWLLMRNDKATEIYTRFEDCCKPYHSHRAKSGVIVQYWKTKASQDKKAQRVQSS